MRRGSPSPLSAGERRRLTPEERMIAGRLVVAVGCTYELVALVHPRLPTISELVYRGSNHKILRFAAWCFGGYALDHLFGD